MEIGACGLCGSDKVELTLVTDIYVCSYCLRSFPEASYPGVPRIINRNLNEIEKGLRQLRSDPKKFAKAKGHLSDMLVLLRSRLATTDSPP